jgi:hypothetical protein
MTDWEAGDSYGRQVRSAAILSLIESQIAAWETERGMALKNADAEPQYNSWQLRAEQLAQYISAAKLCIDKIKEVGG